MKKFIFIIIIIVCLIANLLAQDSTKQLKYQPAQLSFFYPIGIFGIHSQDYAYNFSLNILAGRTGGCEGFEAAGWINVNDQFIRGFQAAGIGNLCFGSGEAFQGAGIFNLARRNFNGFQAAGIINTIGGNAHAAQFGGIANFANGIQGAQFGGIINVSSSDVKGTQFAGIMNTAIGVSDCFQGAGILNISENMEGGQAAGIGNLTLNIKGIQAGGIFNTALNVKGAQIGGIANVAGNVDGVQLAGIINICDSIDGIPVALISFVRKNGYRRFEVSVNEMSYFNLSYKTGVQKFYTLFTVGYNPFDEENNVSYGFGVGSKWMLQNRHSAIDIELRSSQLTKNFETNKTLLYNSLIVDYSLIFMKRFELFAGPSMNVLVANKSLTAAKTSPGWARAFKFDNRVQGWVGFHAGLRF